MNDPLAADSHSPLPCPLCGDSGNKKRIGGADSRRYFHCPCCRLIFIDPEQFLLREQERARYQQHHNSIEETGYVRFLDQVLSPLLPHLTPSSRGLDYGCGPNPVLAELVQRHGLHCDVYDPFFADVPLHPPYDFLLASECFEHFCRPFRDIARICKLLRPGGWLAVMTEFWRDPGQFSTWTYSRDTTHVSFFHAQTLRFLGCRFPLELIWEDQYRVALFRRIKGFCPSIISSPAGD
ncbi:MAG: class I SAM-dependent methyltransferase [Desulfobulbus sp.]